MVKKCTEQDKEIILTYIGHDYVSCLYLYLNLQKYGMNSNVVDVYIQQDEERITAILLRYYSCLHVYSRDNLFDTAELGAFVASDDISMIYCTAETAEMIYASLPEEKKTHSSLTKGWVAQIRKVDREPVGLSVPAKPTDFEQIARLIYEDEDIGKNYNLKELAQQLEQRNQEGYARNYVIRYHDLVVAHACTNAESENIAVVAELLVRKQFRRRGYASEIWREICSTLLFEGKEVYSFYYSEESRALHKKIGFTEPCQWAKIVFDQQA